MEDKCKTREQFEKELSPFQRAIMRTLAKVAELNPDPGECVSEVSLFVQTARLGNEKQDRDTVRTALELLCDRGFCRRVHIHWEFTRRFRPNDVAGLLLWQGKWVSMKSSNNGVQHR